MNPQTIRGTLESYFSPLPQGIEFKVQKYLELLEIWGRKMALTSIKDDEEAIRFHFGESMFALSLGDMVDSRLADVGTGAGFPGLALKLARPHLRVVLIEPNLKKCAFLHEVIRNLDLNGVDVTAQEFKFAGIRDKSLDVIASRALGKQDTLVDWAETRVMSGGSVLLWVGVNDCCRLQLRQGWQWTEPCLIPGANARFVLKGVKRPDCST